jgi:hypothetical protein
VAAASCCNEKNEYNLASSVGTNEACLPAGLVVSLELQCSRREKESIPITTSNYPLGQQVLGFMFPALEDYYRVRNAKAHGLAADSSEDEASCGIGSLGSMARQRKRATIHRWQRMQGCVPMDEPVHPGMHAGMVIVDVEASAKADSDDTNHHKVCQVQSCTRV